MKLYLLALLCLGSAVINAQTVGTTSLNFSDVEEGYTLFAPLNHNTTYLIDNCGNVINSWASDYPPGDEVFFDDEGNLWRAGRTTGEGLIGAGGRGGIIELFSWEGDVIWSYERCDTEECLHHDFRLLPNGNLLILIWDAYSSDEAIAQGANPELLDLVDGVWSEYLEEITPNLQENNSATTVWQWHAWDHLVQDFDETKPNFGVVSDNPNKIDLNFFQNNHPDWLHSNAIDYNSELDQILISIPQFNEFWIVDHNMTTEEGQGEDGDLLFRWGNPIAYDSGTEDDQQVHYSHNAHWIPSDLRYGDDIMFFDNRNLINDANASVVKIIRPTVADDGTYEMSSGQFLPENTVYEYVLPEELHSDKVSGAQMQPNDNILICSGVNGTLLEINEDDQEVWRYKTPIDDLNMPFSQGDDATSHGRWLFRGYKYLPNFSGFDGKDMTPGNPIEENFAFSFCNLINVSEQSLEDIGLYPNPANSILNISTGADIQSVEIISTDGRVVLVSSINNQQTSIDVSRLKTGIFFVKATNKTGSIITSKFTKE